MMWLIIGIVFTLLLIISFFGDYEEKERKEDYRKYEDLISEKEKYMCKLPKSIHLLSRIHRQKRM